MRFLPDLLLKILSDLSSLSSHTSLKYYSLAHSSVSRFPTSQCQWPVWLKLTTQSLTQWVTGSKTKSSQTQSQTVLYFFKMHNIEKCAGIAVPTTSYVTTKTITDKSNGHTYVIVNMLLLKQKWQRWQNNISTNFGTVGNLPRHSYYILM